MQAMQWVGEVRSKAPGLSVALYHGPGRAERLPPALLASYDVIVTTYNTARHPPPCFPLLIRYLPQSLCCVPVDISVVSRL